MNTNKNTVKLTLIRYYTDRENTLGLLYLDNTFVAYTLEDQYQTRKVYGETCIPKGRYRLQLRKAGGSHARYQQHFPSIHNGMLHLLEVPGFEWIYLHIGNTDADTAGCILLGNGVYTRQGTKTRLTNSTEAYTYLYPLISAHLMNKQPVWIEVCGI